MEKIPEEIKKQIDLLVNNHYPTITRRDYRKYLEQGYTLASKEIEDAKAEIEKLKKENGNLRSTESPSSLPEEGEGWISVEDRLPEVKEGHAIEISICSHIFDAEEPMVVASGVFYNGDFYLCAEWHGGDLEMIEPLTPGRITHWQPLPTAPGKPLSAVGKEDEQEKENLKKIRDYFGEHDKTSFEHWAYIYLDTLIKK